MLIKFMTNCYRYSFVNPMLSQSYLQAEHKIQSAAGPLDMRLAQVPKMLSMLRKDWAPLAFCISFKVSFVGIITHLAVDFVVS